MRPDGAMYVNQRHALGGGQAPTLHFPPPTPDSGAYPGSGWEFMAKNGLGAGRMKRARKRRGQDQSWCRSSAERSSAAARAGSGASRIAEITATPLAPASSTAPT